MIFEEVKVWMLDPDATYTIKSGKEYDLIIERLIRLEDMVEDPSNLKDPFAMELLKLSNGAIKWEEEYEPDTLFWKSRLNK